MATHEFQDEHNKVTNPGSFFSPHTIYGVVIKHDAERNQQWYFELMSFVDAVHPWFLPLVEEVVLYEKIHSRPAVFSHGTARGEIDTFNKAGYNLRITGKTLDDVLAAYQKAVGVTPIVEQPVRISTVSEPPVASATDADEESDPDNIPQAIVQAMSLDDDDMDIRLAAVSTPIRKLANLIFKKAVEVSASTISIRYISNESDPGWFISFRIEDEWKSWYSFPSREMARMVIARLKLIAGWKLEEFMELKALVDVRINGDTYICEFAIAPREYGEIVTILIKKKDQGSVWNMSNTNEPENISLNCLVGNLITNQMAADFRIVPIEQRGELLVLATDVQHVSLMVRERLTRRLDRPVEFVWVETEKLNAALRKYYVVTEADLPEDSK